MAIIRQCDRCRSTGKTTHDVLEFHFGTAQDGRALDPVSKIDLCSECRKQMIRFLEPLPVVVEKSK